MPDATSERPSSSEAHQRIVAPGLMADQVRAFDWSKTPLGPIGQWSDTLASAVNQVLYTPGPATLSWGRELIFFYNDATIPTLGRKHPSALGLSYREVFAEAWSRVGEDMEACYNHARTATREDILIPIIVNGSLEEHYWAYTLIPIHENGQVAGVFDPYQNITAQRRAKEESANARHAAEGSAKQLALALDAGDLATWYYDPERQIVGGDTRMARLFGLANPQGPVQIWIDQVHPEDRARVAEEFAAALKGQPYNTEYRVCHGNAVHWVRAQARQVGHLDLPRFIGVCEDITVRKANEERLRSVAERLHLAQAAARIASWEWDIPSGTISWAGATEWVVGRPPSHVDTAEKCLATIHPEDVAALQQALEPVLAGKGGLQTEYRVVWPDEPVHWIYGKAETVFSKENGEPWRVVGINMNITERKISEAALLQQEKLAAVGRLSASIAHEINNPLESVTNLLYLARISKDGADIQSYLNLAERELRRVSVISNQTLRFHRQSTAPREVACTELFENVLSIHQGRIINSHIEVEKRKRAHRLIRCFDGEIRQVLNNLVSNAIDAMHPLGGRLIVRSRDATNWRTGQQGVVLTVADTGTGMPPPVAAKIFEAFYTTKGIGGTGLGLWVSKEIVDRHHGTLHVRSSQTQGHSGTVFALFLPLDPVSRD